MLPVNELYCATVGYFQLGAFSQLFSISALLMYKDDSW